MVRLLFQRKTSRAGSGFHRWRLQWGAEAALISVRVAVAVARIRSERTAHLWDDDAALSARVGVGQAFLVEGRCAQLDEALLELDVLRREARVRLRHLGVRSSRTAGEGAGASLGCLVQPAQWVCLGTSLNSLDASLYGTSGTRGGLNTRR